MKPVLEIELSNKIKLKETVVLVHGLWMHGCVMSLLEKKLQRCGFNTAVFSYSSMRTSLSQNARALSRFAADLAATRIHFVGHSLGGLLLLQMLAEQFEPRIGRIVLLGSPYHASYVARKLARTKIGRFLIGRSMQQWLEQKTPIKINQYEIGSIAGCISLGVGKLIGGVPRPNDGVVTVEETQMPQAKDWIILHVNHSGMLFSSKIAQQVCIFFRQGYFLHNQETA